MEKRSNSDGGKLSKSFYFAKKVVNCGGNYSDEVDLLLPRSIDEGQPFLIQPGRVGHSSGLNSEKKLQFSAI